MASSPHSDPDPASFLARVRAGTWSSALRRLALVGILAVSTALRLQFLAGSIVDHDSFFVQPQQEVLAQVARGEKPYINDLGYEASNIGCAWVCEGQGFASPFGGSTGPTAWIAPGFVALYAVSFALFGCFTTGATLALFGVALMLSLATCWLVFRITFALFANFATALIAALLFALAPYDAWIYRVAAEMDFNVQTFFFALLLFLALGYAASPTRRRLLGLAAATGCATLFYPGFVLCSVVAVALSPASGRPALRTAHTALLALVTIAIVSPYVIWQRTRLGSWVAVKSNGPFELYLGNTPEAKGVLNSRVFRLHHPSQDRSEFLHYREVGEMAYIGERFAAFRREFSWGSFAVDCGRRTLWYFLLYETKGWDVRTGTTTIKKAIWAVPGIVLLIFPFLGRAGRNRGTLMTYGVVLSFALPFLLAGVMERYRTPIAPAVIALAAGLLPLPRTMLRTESV
jgi:hypothetical protein